MSTTEQDAAASLAEALPRSAEPSAQPLAIAIPDNPTPSQLLAIAIHRGDALDKLEKLMDLRDRWEAGEARKAYTAAMARFKADPPTIIKDKLVGYENRDGSYTGYKHATLAECATKIAAGLASVGISHRWDVKHEGRAIIVSCTLTHKAGHSETLTMPPVMPDDSGKKNAIQQVASAITYQQRYSLLAITGLAAKDQDDDGRAGGGTDTLTKEQVDELEALIKKHGVDRSGFLRFTRVDSLGDILACNFEAAKQAILDRKGKGKGGTSAPEPKRQTRDAGATRSYITPAQVRELEQAADRAGVLERALLTRYDVDSLADMNADQFARALEYIKGLHP